MTPAPAPTEPPRVLVYVVTAPVSAQTLLRGQLEWMSKRGYDVHLITADGPGLPEVRERKCVTVHVVPFRREISLWPDVKTLIALYRLLRRLRPEIVNYSTPKASLVGAIASRLAGVKRRVYVVRGLRLEGATTRFQRWVLRTSELVAIRAATDVFAVSPSLATALEANRLIRASEVRIPGPGSSNGFDMTRLATVDTERVRQLRRALSLPPDALLVGYVGRLTTDKGVRELGLALHQDALDQVHLLTVGTVEESDVDADLKALGIRWHHVPFTPASLDHLACCDVFALPTYREGFPNVVLEASALGIPVVTTTATGAVDSILHEVTGLLVPPRDPFALASAIQRLLRDPGLRLSLGAAGRLHAEHFDPQNVWRAYAQVYEADK